MKLYSFSTTAVASLVLSLIVVSSPCSQTLSLPFSPAITVRVDTTRQEIAEVYHLITNYLNSRPDSLYANPYWSDFENRTYAEPYTARQWIYSFRSVVRTFPPRILSIEKVDSCYCCRILYYAENLDSTTAATNPWALQRLYACPENGSLKLFDPLRKNSANWTRTRVGRVEFIYPPDHAFDSTAAERTSRFVDSLTTVFDPPDQPVLHFYITRGVDAMNALVGLDYTLNISEGRAIVPNHIILTALDSEWFPHEVVHAVVDGQSPYIVSEGIATLLGGNGLATCPELISDLSHFLDSDDSLTFAEIVDHPYQGGTFDHFYAVGAVLCRAALDTGGVEAMKRLLYSGSDNETLYRLIEETFEIKRSDIMDMIRVKARQYAGR